ncbi:MarR family winged helix-turn-helix transcriptional regulator [Marinibactrum halimedae]|uniref:HTH marR-type domain-containing protein n=1 Tax=Marinibactrum halimedae TaxID=1444977 RepID=A0AA37T5R4_9GAMM|nr:MarR family winged helix-turn-helix transcriptional regulator [Marinibactrum halimedae]MCD9459437.1 MarR family winged helix-turn-helix transcriptional regulator [Marinibactrum halimedae]GLS27495.1 hypothetical protein GCM10007877_32140 [Marinibactrum halimedae]
MAKKLSAADKLAAWRSVIEAYQMCNQKYTSLMSYFELTPSQFDVLLAVDGLGEQAVPKNIASRLLVTKGNITNVTKRLFERQLITQKANGLDARSVVIELTPQGQDLVDRAKIAAKAFISEQLSPFGDQQIENVGKLMRQMREHLEQMDVSRILKEVF